MGKKYAVISKTIFCCYMLYFIFFSSFYFGQYNNQISETFRDGVQDAITYTKSQGYEDICVDSSIYYPQVLFFDQTPHSTFENTVKYTSYPAAFLNAMAFSNYTFGIDYQQLNPQTTYIIKNDAAQHFISNDYRVVYFENYAVATKN